MNSGPGFSKGARSISPRPFQEFVAGSMSCKAPRRWFRNSAPGYFSGDGGEAQFASDIKETRLRKQWIDSRQWPTGCGKSSTLAALIQEINLSDARHIVTIESPIEYTFAPDALTSAKREVGRDTPSFDRDCSMRCARS